MNKKLVCAFLSTFSFLIVAQKWDGLHYSNHSSHQYDLAANYLKEIPLESYDSILDIGCGSGAITAHIAASAPESEVIGMDLSKSMIAAARCQHQSVSNLSFYVANGERFSFERTFNLIFSSSTFHWIKDQQCALACIARHLEPNGELHILMTADAPSFVKAFNATLQKQKWRSVFAAHENPVLAYFQTPERIADMVRAAGLSVIKAETVEIKRVFKDRQSFEDWLIGFVGGVPVVGSLSKKEQCEYARDYIDAYISLFGTQMDGSILYCLPSLRLHAIKK